MALYIRWIHIHVNYFIALIYTMYYNVLCSDIGLLDWLLFREIRPRKRNPLKKLNRQLWTVALLLISSLTKHTFTVAAIFYILNECEDLHHRCQMHMIEIVMLLKSTLNITSISLVPILYKYRKLIFKAGIMIKAGALNFLFRKLLR